MKIVLPVASHQRLNLHANKLCPNQPNFLFTQCCNEVFLTGLMSYNYLMVYRPTTTIREDFQKEKRKKNKKRLVVGFLPHKSFHHFHLP